MRESPAWHTRARLKRAKARRLLQAHHGSAPPISKTWECGKCGRNNPPHRRKCQIWTCRERGPAYEDKLQQGYWDCGCGCESNYASRSKCRSCGAARCQHHQQHGQRSRKPPSMQSSFATVVAEVAAKLHAQLGQPLYDGRWSRGGSVGRGRARAASYLTGEPGCLHRSFHAGRGGRRGRRTDLAGQVGGAKGGSGPTLGPQTRQTRSTRRSVEEDESVHGAVHGQARDEKANELEAVEAEARTAREGNVHRSPIRSPSPAGLQSALDGDARESSSGSSKSAFRCNSSSLNNSSYMQAEVPMRRSPVRATEWCNRVRCRGCAQCGDDIDRKWGGRRHWAFFSARDKVPKARKC